MMTGFTTELLHLPVKSTSDPELESDFFHTFTVDWREEDADPKDTTMPAPRLFDGAFNSFRSRNLLKKIRKETDLRSMPELFQMKDAEPSTELLLST